MKRSTIIVISIIMIIALLIITIRVFFSPEKEQQKDEITYEQIEKNMYTTYDDTLYEEDNIGSIHLYEIEKGSEIYVKECNNTGWCKVSINDMDGYMQKNILTDEKIIEEDQIDDEQPIEENNNVSEQVDPMIEKKDIVYASTDANIRSSMEYGNNIVGVLKYNESINRIGIIGNWSVVTYNDTTCYIASSVLMTNKIERKEINTNVKQDGSIDSSKPMVALTFDDGPGLSTSRILDTLEKYNVKATFFDLGNLMYRYSDTVYREAKIGEVGTHTYSHLNLNNMNINDLQNEIASSKKTYKDILGYEPTLIRPPYGNANQAVKGQITDMAIINWNVDTLDWKSKNADAIINQVISSGDLNGDIILMHSIYSSTADAVEYLVPYLINEGYQLVTVSELASYKGVTLTSGTIYYHF